MLDTQRLSPAIGIYRTVIDTATQIVETLAKHAKLINQLYKLKALQISTGFNPHTQQLFIGDLADTVNSLDRQLLNKSRNILRGYHKLPIGFLDIASDLGKKFVWCNARRNRHPHLGFDNPADLLGDQCSAATAKFRLSHIQISLIQRQRFYFVCIAIKYLADF